MSSKSKAGSAIRRGEIAVPEQVFNLLLIASGAKLPEREKAVIARTVAKRLGDMVRRQHASAKRLRESHGWTAEDALEPYLVIIERNFYVVPRLRRFEKGETLAKIAVQLHYVLPDADTQDDPTEEWVPIKNTGPGKMSYDTPPWVRLTLATGEAEWLETCLDAAMKPSGHGEQVRPPMLRASVENAIHLAYAYDVLAWAKSPDGQPKPNLALAYDADGALREVQPTGSLADQRAADRELWEDAKTAPAATAAATTGTSTPIAATRGGEG